MIFAKDLEGRYLFVNRHFSRTFGIPFSKMKGRTDVEIFGKAAGRVFNTNDREVARRDQTLTFEEHADLSDGKHVYFSEKFPLHDDAGEVVAVCGIASDLTERRRLEGYRDLCVEAGQRLVESLDLKTTLETIADLAARHLSRTFTLNLADENGKIVDQIARCALPWAKAVLEKTREYAPLLPSAHPTQQALATGKSVSIQRVTPEVLDAVSVDERHREMLEDLGVKSVASVPLVARGRLLGALTVAWAEAERATDEMIGVVSSLADRAALAIDNAQLFANWKEAAGLREEVVGVIGHDLRNPLQAILLSTRMLLSMKDEPLTERQAEAVARIGSAAGRMRRLIHALLDFAGVRAGALKLERRPLDFHALVRAVCDEHALAWPDRSIDVQQSGSGAGEWDEARLSQLVANLISNALQYSPADSSVLVRTEGTSGEILFAVHNEGEPIDKALLPVLFEPFRRGSRGAKGSIGLGLYISKQVAAAHGGSISVNSSAERGTTFILRVPRLAKTTSARPGEGLHLSYEDSHAR
jgi:PAS domain S-box-containing protein